VKIRGLKIHEPPWASVFYVV